MTTSDQIDIAKQNTALTLYYLLTDKRIPESKYEDYTDIIPMELKKLTNQCTHTSKQKYQVKNLIV